MGIAVAVAGVIVGPTGVITTPTSASAAEAFQPGNIISDVLFYDSTTMSAADIQSFLVSQVGGCQAGYTCLDTYSQATADQPASAYCKAYKGWGAQRAADIIHDVAVACSINPQVLLVMLEKEQGLVTDDWPGARQYRSAMGYGCPDTAACDTQYYGFFNQVYQAARRFQVYKAEPRSYKHQPFATNDVLYNPNSTCGSSKVYIADYATAGLYNYTPYQPNAAALAAGNGVGDSCSAYGNRNFYNYFVKWFGSTQRIVKGAIGALWQNVYGGSTGALGNPTTNENCTLTGGTGCVQLFEHGQIHWTNSTGAHATWGAIRGEWGTTGWETGALGYPTGEPVCGLKDGGCYQWFQGGQVHWSNTTGAHYTKGTIASEWAANGWESGALGYPTSDPACGLKDGGCFQYFQKAIVHASASTGAHYTTGGIQKVWGSAYAWENGRFGYPTSDPTCDTSARCAQTFQGGRLYLDDKNNAIPVWNDILTDYTAAGGPTGTLGYPTMGEICGIKDGGCYQYFQSGQIHWSAKTGAHYTQGAVRTAWGSYGWESGKLGYPTADPACDANGRCWQPFQTGQLYTTSQTGQQSAASSYGQQSTTSQTAYLVAGGIGGAYVRQGGARGPLGWPTSGENCGLVAGGCFQYFENGQIHWSAASGAHATAGAVKSTWGSTGWERGKLGYPISDYNCGIKDGGCFQQFQGGDIHWSSATGANYTTGAIRSFWASQGWENGALGYPTSGESCTADGQQCTQTFQGGTVRWTATGGARVQ